MPPPLEGREGKILLAAGSSVDDFHFCLVYDDGRTGWSKRSVFSNTVVPSFTSSFTSGEIGMRKLLVASVIMALGWVAVGMNSGAQDTKEKASIKEVMKIAMKGGLTAKVQKGEATEEEKKKLAGLFAALHENAPPKGEKSSWDEKTKALVDAANAVLKGEAGAGDKLKTAANCAACHSAHKGK
jgi:hypothetical protein